MSQPIRSQGGHLAFPIGLKNTNLVEEVEILLPVKFHWIPFSGFRGEVENVSANQRPGRPSCFSDRPEKHKLCRGRWDLASCQVSLNSVQRFQRRSRKCEKLKQQNRYLWVIIVWGYFSVIRSFTWLNCPSESNSYHKISLSVSFGCWHLSGIPLFPLHFTVYTIGVTEEIRTAMRSKHQFMHFKWLKGQIPTTFITCALRNSHTI